MCYLLVYLTETCVSRKVTYALLIVEFVVVVVVVVVVVELVSF